MVDAPAADEIEISVFGRGYGEAILVHFGDGNWFSIDCLNDAAGEPAPLGYLSAIGVSPERVSGLLATHWHDDHVRGLAGAHAAFVNALFFLPLAMDSKEWIEFNQSHRNKGTARISSGLKELRAIALAQAAGRSPAKYAVANRVLLRVAGGALSHGVDVSFEALGPSDEDIKAFLQQVAAVVPTALRVEPFGKNDVSVPVWLRVGDHRILFGADLEVAKSQNRGWNAVHASGARLDGQASLVKVAHHGSSNGHHDGIWDDHISAEVIAILSPWNRGHKLPKQSDVDRIVDRSKSSFSTSRMQRKPPPRPAVVTKTLKQFNQTVRPRPADVGQVRVRFRPSDSPSDWRIELLDGAIRLSDLLT